MTSYFEIQACPNRKQKKESAYVAVEKQQRKSKTGRKWKVNEETGSSLLACLYGPDQKIVKAKIEILWLPCGKQGEQKRLMRPISLSLAYVYIYWC